MIIASSKCWASSRGNVISQRFNSKTVWTVIETGLRNALNILQYIPLPGVQLFSTVGSVALGAKDLAEIKDTIAKLKAQTATQRDEFINQQVNLVYDN
ncbi:hypothetical protein CAOG_010245, partial [Capsaspora owczarzaki ATCC 30864]